MQPVEDEAVAQPGENSSAGVSLRFVSSEAAAALVGKGGEDEKTMFRSGRSPMLLPVVPVDASKPSRALSDSTNMPFRLRYS